MNSFYPSLTEWITLLGGLYFLFVILSTTYVLYLAVRETKDVLASIPTKKPSFTSSEATTIVVAAFNEELTIVDSIQSHFLQKGPQVRVVVVCDGCTDQTLLRLIDTFNLSIYKYPLPFGITCAPVKAVYQDPLGRLIVVDKARAGKADALNCGLNYVFTPTFCVVDADSHLSDGALAELLGVFSDTNVIAAGGAVRIEPHSEHAALASDPSTRSVLGWRDALKNITTLLSPFNIGHTLVGLQWVEYVRSCVWMRMGWSRMDSLMIISGAFGMFLTDRVKAIGGYRTDTVGEDMELVLRLHRIYGPQGARISYRSGAVCYTQGPHYFSELAGQRKRWHRGLLESLWSHPAPILHSKNPYGPLGLSMFVFLEVLSPLIEGLGFIFLCLLWAFDVLDTSFIVYYLLAGCVCYGLISYLTLSLDAHYYPQQQQHATGAKRPLVFLMLLELLCLRLVHTYWRLGASVRWALQHRSQWGHIERRAISTKNATGGAQI